MVVYHRYVEIIVLYNLYIMRILEENERSVVLVKPISVVGRMPDYGNYDHPLIEAVCPAIEVTEDNGRVYINPLDGSSIEIGKNVLVWNWGTGTAWKCQSKENGSQIVMPARFLTGEHKGKIAILTSGEPESEWTYRPQSEGSSVTLRVAFDRHLSDDERKAVRFAPDDAHKFREQD